MEAIRTSDLVLLIFSASANASPYVLREIERAVAYGRPVLSLHADDAVPNASLEYYLNLWQWLAIPGRVQDKRDDIIAAVRGQLASAPGIAGTGKAHRPSRRAWLIALAAVLLMAGVGLGLGLGLTRQHDLWTKLSPEGTLPSARYGHAMAYDSSNGLLILFGGTGGQQPDPFDDTWAYDPVADTWIPLNPSGTLPAGRYTHAMVYDPVTERVIMFGGDYNSGGNPDGTGQLFDDTWAYDATANTWTNLNPSGAVPSARAAHTMAYDPGTRRLIMFGGFDDSGSRLNETWAYDPVANNWTELLPSGTLPLGRAGHCVVYHPSSSLMIVFSGENAGNVLNDTWAYDPAANSWTELHPPGRLPEQRYGAMMAYDASDGRLCMFGGASSILLDGTWAYDTRANSWTELSMSGARPSALFGSSMVYEPSIGRVIMFGGVTDGGSLNDTWALTP
jgi:N-acetylneuraminic acid mutarotase